MATWKHNPKSKNDQTGNPTNTQFFSNETVGNLSNALIREGIQNNLDEIKDIRKPVKVRLFLSGKKYAIKPKDFKPYISELIPHLKAENNGIIPSQLPNFNEPVKFLVFEDFNTKGLEGDPFEFKFDEAMNPTKPHNFYFFWRAYGISGKLDGKMGSWGVGKSVFPASSQVNSFFAMTIRHSDRKAYLIGQSVLKTHNLIEKPSECGYSPYGNFGKFDADGFSLPEESEEEIKKFVQTFRLHRDISENASENTGLSIVIPYPKDDLTSNSLFLSTIEQFFYPILIGKLEVEISHEDTTYYLNAKNIRNELERIELDPETSFDTKSNLLSLFDFVEWGAKIEQSEFVELQFDNPERAYEWRKDELFKNINLDNLRNKFDSELPLAFRIPIKFQPEGKEPELRYFSAYIQKNSNLQEPENHFIRNYLNIVGVKSLKKKGTRGMVLISDKDLVTFFGQAEGPAHTGWHKENFRVKYESAEGCISFVRRSLEKLYSILLLPSEGLDKNLLQGYFYITDSPDETPKGKGKDEGKKEILDRPQIPPPTPKPYLVTKIDGGFKVSSNPECKVDDKGFIVRVAYDRFDGNPFNKYSEFDFSLKRLLIEQKSIQNINVNMNTIIFEPVDGEFELKVSGFDQKRDIIVEVN